MDHTLPLPASSEEVEDLEAAIVRCLDVIAALQEQMHQSDSAIAESRQKTDSVLTEITGALADLKAA